MTGEHGGQDHPFSKRSGNWFDRTWLPNSLYKFGRVPFCWKNVVFTCPAPWMTGMTSICSCSTLHAILTGRRSLICCKFLPFPHQVATLFTVPTGHSKVARSSNRYVFFWTLCLITLRVNFALSGAFSNPLCFS